MPLLRYRAPDAFIQKSDDSEWKWGVGFEGAFRQRMEDAFAAYRKVLVDALDAGVPPDRLPYRDAEDALRRKWGEVAQAIVMRAGEQAMEELGDNARFLIDNPYTAAWAKEYGSALVTEVSEDTKDLIRAEIHRGIIEHRPVRETAQEIRSLIGLQSRQARARDAYRNALGMEGYTPDQVQEKVDAYTRRLIRQRALVIARTETMRAMNAGIHDAWNVARDQGLLSPLTRRRWIAGSGSDRTCAICMSFHRTETTLDKPFHSDLAGDRMTPPAHPQCRCRAVLVTVVPGMAENASHPLIGPREQDKPLLPDEEVAHGLAELVSLGYRLEPTDAKELERAEAEATFEYDPDPRRRWVMFDRQPPSLYAVAEEVMHARQYEEPQRKSKAAEAFASGDDSAKFLLKCEVEIEAQLNLMARARRDGWPSYVMKDLEDAREYWELQLRKGQDAQMRMTAGDYEDDGPTPRKTRKSLSRPGVTVTDSWAGSHGRITIAFDVRNALFVKSCLYAVDETTGLKWIPNAYLGEYKRGADPNRFMFRLTPSGHAGAEPPAIGSFLSFVPRE